MSPQYKNRLFPINSVASALIDVTLEIQRHTQAPLPMVFSTILAGIAIACQRRVRVKQPSGSTSGVSLYILIVALSGDRKSTSDEIILQPIRAFEESFTETKKLACAKYQSETEIWTLKQKVLQAKFEKNCSQNKSTTAEEDAIREHEKLRPQLAKTPKIIYTNATPEALAYGLYENWPSAALISDEADMILNGHAARDLALLNKLRDGNKITVDRRSQESFTVNNACMSASFMIQPGPFEKFLGNQGAEARSIGFLARCLTTWPETTQGTRFISGIQDVNLKNMKGYQDRITKLLEDGYEHIDDEPITLELSEEATSEYINFYNFIEGSMAEGQHFCDIRDAASKIVETTVRMSALFHHYEGREGKIKVDSFCSAKDICYWYLEEYKRIFGAKVEIPQEQVDAQLLEAWLFNFISRNPTYYSIKKNTLRQNGPNVLRSKSRLEYAIMELERQGKIWVTTLNRTNWVNLSSNYFTAPRYTYPHAELSTIGPNVHFTHQY
jgi:putative DNA primase/helicase